MYCIGWEHPKYNVLHLLNVKKVLKSSSKHTKSETA